MDESGYIFVSDSGNNRVQMFTSDGQYVRHLGKWGSNMGEFKGIEGIAVNSQLGQVLVADRENHRVQVL